MQEPLRWRLDPGIPDPSGSATACRVRRALLGPCDDTAVPPSWLMPHQAMAWRRVRAILRAFRGAMLCDSVGLGKTYVALALAVDVGRVTAVVPASVVSQWNRLSRALEVPLNIVSHEALSRRRAVPPADLILVDEAHRFRNAGTRRYDQLARSVGNAAVLLITATPVVNTPADLVRLMQIFLPDHGLALFGVPSLERAAQPVATPAFSAAAGLVMVSRSRESAGLRVDSLPAVRDAPVTRPPPLAPEVTDAVIVQIRTLDFPTFESVRARELLHLHLLLRLSSSPEALLHSLRRHRRFLDRAIERGKRGERPSRREMRQLLFEPEDQQLDLLDVLGSVGGHADVSAFVEERERIARLVDTVRGAGRSRPKQQELLELVASRRSRKTVVFTSAVPTALALADALGWERVAAVTGRGARIASGRLGVNDALDLFAPDARGRARPPGHARVDVLVATDLASEGVNLQDADAVVHYDIPWTPLRLQQRLGRIARLGSRHRIALTWWFVPPPPLERHLQLDRRLREKSRMQQRHGVPVSSRLGRGTVAGLSLERRERLATWTAPQDAPGACHARAVGAVGSVAAIRWDLGGDRAAKVIPEVIAWRDGVDGEIEALDERCAITARLLRARSAAPAPIPNLRSLHAIVRRRLGGAATGPRDAATRRVIRRIARHARHAGRHRRHDRLTRLDEVLTRVARGVPVGGLRELDPLLENPIDWPGLREWCEKWPTRPSPSPRVCLDAVWSGDLK